MNKAKTDKVIDDEALVGAFQSGNKLAFNDLVLRHKDHIFSLCYRFLGDYQEAEDCTQDAFIKVYRSLKRFRFESSFYTWLYRIAVNTCKNRLKSVRYRKIRKSISLNNPETSYENHRSIQIEDEEKSPMAELEKKERMRLIQKAIDSLSTEQKSVLILRDIEGLSYEEIVSITGCRLGTLKSRLARARHGLRERLEGII